MNAYKRNMKGIESKMKPKWIVAETIETNKAIFQSISKPVKGWILVSCWISNMLIPTKPWKIAPARKTTTIAITIEQQQLLSYSDVKDFDGNSYCIRILTCMNMNDL